MSEPRRRVAFRVDASNQIGTGHVMRCLTLAERLREHGAEILFVSRAHEGHLCDLMEKRGFSVCRLSAHELEWTVDSEAPSHAPWLGAPWRADADETLHAIADFRPDWLVIDHYGIEARWEQAMRLVVGRIMAIDDLADRAHDCDLLLDQNLSTLVADGYRKKVPQGCSLLLGPSYALLRPEYAAFRRRTSPRSGKLERILVSFGGVDKDGLTLKTVDALLASSMQDVAVDIVLSASSEQFQVIDERIAHKSDFTLHDRTPSLAPLILAADLAIGASGLTNWERLCLGLPAIIVTVADNQRPLAEELSRRNLAQWLGDATSVDERRIREAVETLLASGLDPAWSERCLSIVDGLGVARVAAALEANPDTKIVFRHAELADEALLLEWANDPVVRANAFNPSRISPEVHRAWYRARLRNPLRCTLYIAETAFGVPLGQVRFDKRDGEWEISYALAPAFRGRGIGRRMLLSAIETWQEDHPGEPIIGQVKPENAASRRIFEALGFAIRSADPDRLVFEQTYEN